MKRLKEEKIEISHCPNSIAIETFRKEIRRDTRLLVKLTKTTPYSLEVFYEKIQKFINVEREMKPGKVITSTSQPSLLRARMWKGNLSWIGIPILFVLNQQ